MPVAITDDTGFISAVSDLTLKPEDPEKSIVSHERIIANLLNNDNIIASKFANIPKIWECLWYNDPSRDGYKVGTLCWRNIEDMRDFIYMHYSDIYGYVSENPHVLTKPPIIYNIMQLNDPETYDDYVNCLTGWVNQQRTTEPLCMIYDLGDVANPPQVYVSLMDNNKCALDDRSAWKPVLVTERNIYKELSSHGYGLAAYAMNKHLMNYHLGDTAEGAKLNLSKYLNTSLDNFKFPFNYYINPLDQTINGMDWPIKFVEKPLVFSERGADLSDTIVEHQWFRLWKSGYLEHGGTIDLMRHLNKIGFPEIHFDWPLTGLTGLSTDGAQLINYGYLGGRGSVSASIDDTALCVSEELFAQDNEDAPGDNFLSVLHSTSGTLRLNTDFLDKTFVNMRLAPVFALSIYPYSLQICPVNPDFPLELSDVTSAYIESSTAFPGISNNVGIQTALHDSEITSAYFQLSAYDAESPLYPRFITYYASGWSVEYIDDSARRPEDKILLTDDEL